MQKTIAVEHEKHEDGLQDKKGEAHDGLDDISKVVQSFNILV